MADIADPFVKATSATSATAGESAAERTLALMREMSPDLRGGAIIDADGAVLGATGEERDWASAAEALFAAADAAGAEPAEAVHVATEAGEVFALRHAGLAGVTVTERFTLASLALYDLRSALRDLAAQRERPAEP